MPTARLTPSTYYLTSTSYLSVSNADHMYTDTDSTTYAEVYNSRTSTTSYYIYIRGFNFDAIPAAAEVDSFTVKLKGNYSGGYSQNMYLYNGTSASVGSSSSLSSTVATHDFTCSVPWADLVAMGDNFGIRINCRRSSRNTAAHFYIYGAEIEVNYTLPNPATVTSTLTGNGTISPAGAYSTYDGEEYTLTITPTDKSEPVTATKDGADITAQLVAHGAGSTITATPADYELDSIQSGSSYAAYCIGCSAEEPSSFGTSSNMYSGDIGYADYSFDFSGIPSGATIEAIEVRCYGHRESASLDSSHVSAVEIMVNGTAISESVDFPSQRNTLITVTPDSLPTRAQLDSATVRHTVGYYGGLVLGISFDVTYSVGTGIDHYTYTYTVSGDSVIAVTIGGGSGETDHLWVKRSGSYAEAVKAWKKQNGTYTEIPITDAFSADKKYVCGD